MIRNLELHNRGTASLVPLMRLPFKRNHIRYWIYPRNK